MPSTVRTFRADDSDEFLTIDMTGPTPAAARFTFDDFELTETELTRNGQVVPIEPRPLALLHHLVRRRPEIVSKKELTTEVWRAHVHPGTVDKAVSRVREAMQDDARYPKYVETVPRRGHRFVAKVRVRTSSGMGPSREPVRGSSEPHYAGDRSRFVRDVTVPDGSVVFVNQTFLKVWEIQNVGRVPWRNRFLLRLGLLEGPGRLKSPERTPIPDTEPGEQCRIEVELTAPRFPGSCYAEWKMVDASGAFLLPNQIPVYVSVDVREYPTDRNRQARR